jgi:CelD/BcsL family acetyltransferase involved in cellulose biosynthesis
MPTQVMFEGQIGDALRPLGTEAEPYEELAAIDHGAGPQAVDLSLHDDLASIEKEWREFEKHADCTVFQTFDWLSTWLKHLGCREGVKPVIVIGRQRGTILFVMPFALDATGRTLGWLGSSLCNYNGPLLDRDFPARVDRVQFLQIWREVRRLLRSRLGHDLIDLEKMPETIGGQPNPFCALNVTPHMNNAYLSNLGTDWETYYAGTRSSATRRSDRKKQRRLSEHGEVKFLTAKTGDDIARTLDALIAQKTVSYAKLGVDNMFERPGYRDFFLGIATGAQSARLTHLSRIQVGEATAAANFGLVFRGSYNYLLAGYDDGELARFGPGSIQLLEMMRYAIEQGLQVFDFTIGDEPYKREWCDHVLHLYDYVAPTTLRGFAVAAPMLGKRVLKRHIRQSPRIWAAVRKVRMFVSSLRRAG